MNRTFQVVIGVSLVLLVVVLIIFFKGPKTEEPQQAVILEAAKPVPKTEAKPKAKPHAERRHDRAQAAPETASIETAAAPVSKVIVPPPPFPAPADLKAGMRREEMIRKFGNPRVVASWAQNGSLAEKLIYTRDAQVTAVLLVDGRVVKSGTGQNDPRLRSARKAAIAEEESADAEGAKLP